jgi:putative CocE/NonD family hydrolase
MNLPRALRGAAALLLVLSARFALADEPYEIAIFRNVMIPMRDGIRLAADVYRPARSGSLAPGKFPVILERTPYVREWSTDDWVRYFVSRGYIGIVQSVRGRFESGGRWRPHRDDVADGYDTAKWIGEQPWCDGGIGTVGTSYPGGTQHALAIGGAPYVKAMVPIDAMSDYGRYGIRHNGAFELRFFNWIFAIGFAFEGADPPDAFPGIAKESLPEVRKLSEHVREYVKGLPLRPGTTPLKLAPDYEAWLVEAMRHGDYDTFWKNMGASVVDHLAEYKDIPVYHVSGWYDSWGNQVANLNYVELSKAKKSLQRLILGPWTHGGQETTYSGEAEFGPAAAINLNALRQWWFDRWLKGADNGVDREAPVRIFVMGDGDGHKTAEGRVFVGGHWREEREWPLARTKATPYYLRAGGVLSAEKPPAPEPASRYTFDPRHPVPTLGGNISSEGKLINRGAMDQRCRIEVWTCEDTRPLSARNDVLVFQTPPLPADMEVTGRLIVKLFASSSAVDTDFTAKLVDVYPPTAEFPAGVELNVGDSIVRARYRNSLERAEMMKPGEIYPMTIEMYPTSLVFRKGHRIRLDISSSNFPRFDVNPNTGEPLNDNGRWAVAENAVFHDAAHASHILLPIIPASR